MAAASSNVIDFESYRARREQRTASAPLAVFPAMPPVAWVPVWFVPLVPAYGGPLPGTS